MNGGQPKNPGGIAGYSQSVLEATVDAMVARGLRDAGYVYMNLDCGWTDGHRDENGLRVNTTAFPNFTGMIEKIHGVGMKFGMYAGGLHSQCCNRDMKGSNDTSYGHQEEDAKQFIAWKVRSYSLLVQSYLLVYSLPSFTCVFRSIT
jgi:alpha-galactosidase